MINIRKPFILFLILGQVTLFTVGADDRLTVDLDLTSIILARPPRGTFPPEELTSARTGERITFAFTIRNNGTDPSGAFSIEGNVDNGAWVYQGRIPLESAIGPGEQKRFLATFEGYDDPYDPELLRKYYQVTPGEHNVLWSIDTMNEHAEPDEDNNQRTFLFEPEPWDVSSLLSFLYLKSQGKETTKDLDLTDTIDFPEYVIIQQFWEQPGPGPAQNSPSKSKRERVIGSLLATKTGVGNPIDKKASSKTPEPTPTPAPLVILWAPEEAK